MEITADNVEDIVGGLSDVIVQITDPVDESTENLNVVSSIFTDSAGLIDSGNLTASNEVSGVLVSWELILGTNYQVYLL